MKPIFIIAFILFAVAELYLILQMGAKKNKVGSQTTIVNFGLYCVYLLIVYLLRLRIPYYILLLCMIALFINSFVGYSLHYFEKSSRFDRYMHGFGSFSFALLGYYTIIGLTVSGGSKLFQAFFIAFLGIALGSIYEIMEYITDTKKNTRLQKGLKDTDFDMIFNILGSVLAALLFFIF